MKFATAPCHAEVKYWTFAYFFAFILHMYLHFIYFISDTDKTIRVHNILVEFRFGNFVHEFPMELVN